MKNLLLVLVAMRMSIGLAQDIPLALHGGIKLDLNDTSYLRILNGLVIPNDYVVKNFDGVKKIGLSEDKESLGINSAKPIMLISYERCSMEGQVDSVLYNDSAFLEKYPYPLDLQLPIALNGKVLEEDEKQTKLCHLSFSQIKKVEYVAMKDEARTPFGFINDVLK